MCVYAKNCQPKLWMWDSSPSEGISPFYSVAYVFSVSVVSWNDSSVRISL